MRTLLTVSTFAIVFGWAAHAHAQVIYAEVLFAQNQPQGGVGSISAAGTYQLFDMQWPHMVWLDYRKLPDGLKKFHQMAHDTSGTWGGVADAVDSGQNEVQGRLWFNDGAGWETATTAIEIVTVEEMGGGGM